MGRLSDGEKFDGLGTKRRPVWGTERDSKWCQLQQGEVGKQKPLIKSIPLLCHCFSTTPPLILSHKGFEVTYQIKSDNKDGNNEYSFFKA